MYKFIATLLVVFVCSLAWAGGFSGGGFAPGNGYVSGDLQVDRTVYATEFYRNGAQLSASQIGATGMTPGKMPKATSATVVADSTIYENNSGWVGIGSSAPRAKLDVDGNVYLGGGNVGINTAVTRAKLDVEGNVYFKGTMVDITLYTASAGAGGSKSLRISADGTIYGF